MALEIWELCKQISPALIDSRSMNKRLINRLKALEQVCCFFGFDLYKKKLSKGFSKKRLCGFVYL